ncbi:MAG: ShlB/FhaC/HecB family hemolysin secretion/activation protein [Pelistega sp.]|nr:ShlB/FhaC/HecB family hemolysin secretion/activation protein [Pelistega sp.]
MALSMLCISSATAQIPSSIPTPNAAQFEEQRQQQREAQQQAQQQTRSDVHLDAPPQTLPVLNTLSAIGDETPCFPIHAISLQGEEAGRFQFILAVAEQRAGFVPGQCVGVQGIDLLSTYAQNALIDYGYTTSRVAIAPQDLGQGHLALTVLPGYVGEVTINQADASSTRSHRIVGLQNEIPVQSGDVFNLRDIEQGLENYRRVPTVQATVRIEGADRPQYSDIHVDWQQRRVPLRLSVGLDNSGSQHTGRYVGNTTLSGDGLLGLSDLFYVSYNRSLGDKVSLRDDAGHRTDSGTESYSLHYSIPWGYWQIFYNQSYYRYHQAIAGAYEHYDYNGRSLNRELGISRTLYRDNQRKTLASVKLWQRRSHNYIADAEVDVQRKKMGGWQATLSHKEFIGANTLGIDVSYRRGTGLLGSEQPAENLFGEGTSRMRVMTADVHWHMPFQRGQETFAWDSRVHAQWNKTPLVTQDQLAIGGRYTVRGFDGELYLMAERGWYWRNDLIWQYQPSHQLYLGLDVGRVSGPSARNLLGQTLAGAVVGLRGQFALGGDSGSWGQWHYDVSVGTPLKKPSNFKTKNTTINFNLNYAF